MKRLLLASTALVCFATPASADPFSIGVAISSTLLSTTGVALAVSPVLIGQIALGVASIGAQFGLAALNRPRVAPPEATKTTFANEATSAVFAFGRVRLEGLPAFGNSNGTFRDRVIWHCQDEIVAIEDYYLGGRSVVVESDGAVSSPPWGRPNNLSFAYLATQVGNGSETAFAPLISRYPDIIDASFKGLGVAKTHKVLISPGITSAKFLKLYSGSSDPAVAVVARVGRPYDPRTGLSTAWSDNGILIAAHVAMRDPSFKFSDFDWSLIASEANKADALVPTLTGTEPRARAWGTYRGSDGRPETLQGILASIGARMRITNEGKFWFQLLDDNPTPEFTFEASDILSIEGPGRDDAVSRPNELRLSYLSPEREFEISEIDLTGKAWARNSFDQTAYGVKDDQIDLRFCPSASQAQRIGRRVFQRKLGRSGVLVCNWAGLSAWGMSTIAFPLPDLGETIIAEIGQVRVNKQNGTVEIPFSELETLTAWNPATDEAAAPVPHKEYEYTSDISTPAAPTIGQSGRYGSGGPVDLRVRHYRPFGATLDEVQYRLIDGSGNPVGSWQSMTESISTDGTVRFSVANVDLTGDRVQFRSRSYNDDEDGSNLSAILDVDPLAFDATGPSNLETDDAAAVETTLSNGNPGPIEFDGEFRTNSLNASYLTLERAEYVTGNPSYSLVQTESIRADETVVFSDTRSVNSGTTVSWRVRLYGSTGVLGQTLIYSRTASAA